MNELPKAVATTHIEVNVTCPHCGEETDIFSHHRQYAMFEGHEDPLFGCKDFDEKLECQHCLKDFIVSEVQY
jgi:hypothetical protein